MDRDDLIRKVQAILSLSRDGGASEAEAENAARFAARLMRENELSDAELASDDCHERAADFENAEFLKQSAFGGGISIKSWEAALGGYVSDVCGVQCYRCPTKEMERDANGSPVFDRDGKTENKRTMQFYGVADSVRVAVEYYSDLRLLIAACARGHFGSALRGPGCDYGSGFVSGLWDTLKKDRITEQATLTADRTCDVTALATVKKASEIKRERAAWAKAQLAASGIRLTNTCSAGIRDSGAFGRGRSDGQKYQGSPKRAARLTA